MGAVLSEVTLPVSVLTKTLQVKASENESTRLSASVSDYASAHVRANVSVIVSLSLSASVSLEELGTGWDLELSRFAAQLEIILF